MTTSICSIADCMNANPPKHSGIQCVCLCHTTWGRDFVVQVVTGHRSPRL